jgi:thioredoxin reductase (NADPH)
MRAQAEGFGATIVSSSVDSVRKEGEQFVVETGDGPMRAKAVITATGAKHRHLEVKGEEEFSGRGVSYCATCDGPFFKGKRMIVVGGGDAACDEAMYLSKLTDTVIMVHRKDRFRAQKAVAARVLANPNIDVRFETVIDEIKGGKAVESVSFKDLKTGSIYDEPASVVFIFVGSIPQAAYLPPEVAKDDVGYVVTDDRMETSIPGLFAAGDVRVTPFRQVITAVSDGAVAAHCAAQHIDEIEGKAYL